MRLDTTRAVAAILEKTFVAHGLFQHMFRRYTGRLVREIEPIYVQRMPPKRALKNSATPSPAGYRAACYTAPGGVLFAVATYIWPAMFYIV